MRSAGPPRPARARCEELPTARALVSNAEQLIVIGLSLTAWLAWRDNNRKRFLLVVLGALMLSLSFAPYKQFYLAPFGLVRSELLQQRCAARFIFKTCDQRAKLTFIRFRNGDCA